MKRDLKFLTTAIGSLPHTDTKEAIDLIFETIKDAPLCPQLTKLNPNEDMLTQYTEHFAGMVVDEKTQKCHVDMNSDEYFMQVEELFMDFEEILSLDELNDEILSKYAITEKYASAFPYFLEKLKQTKPPFVKGQIIGAFTLGTSIIDTEKRCCFYDETYREVLTKALTLKALWQVNKFKKASLNSQPIIFLDEPTLSQLGTSAFITVTPDDVLNIINQITEVLHKFGVIVGMHCCGKADWNILINSDLDLINFDAFSFAEHFSLFDKGIKKFLDRNGIIAWGIVPTLSPEILENIDTDKLIELFENAKNLLVEKGVNENTIITQSMLTPSCGAGSLPVEAANKVMNLLNNVSDVLKEKYDGVKA